jgi:hypothetical protein
MLNVRAYLPSMEDFDSLPDTLRDDITTDGENTYVAGIPEELIKPAEGSEQGNEDDGVITNMLQKQKKAEDTEEAFEESEEKKFDEEHKDDDSESTGSDIGGGDLDAGTDEPVEGQDEDSVSDGEPAEEPPTDGTEDEADGEAPDEEEEEETKDIQVAIESYSTLLRHANNQLTHQSAAFMQIGLARIQRQLGITTISNEDFVEGPSATRMVFATEAFGEKVKEAGKAAWAKIVELWKKLVGWVSSIFNRVEEKKEENTYLLTVLTAAENGPEAVDKVPEPPASPARKPFKAGEAIARFKKMKAAQQRAKEWKEQMEKDAKPDPEASGKEYSTLPRMPFVIGENNELSFDGSGELDVLGYIEKSWIPAIERLYVLCESMVNGAPKEIKEGFLKVLDGEVFSQYPTPTIQTAGNCTFHPVPEHLGWAIRDTAEKNDAKFGIKANDPNAKIAGKANEKVLAKLETLKPIASKIESYVGKFEALHQKLGKDNWEAQAHVGTVARACNINDIGRTLYSIETRVKYRIQFMDQVAAATIQHNTF